MRPILKVRRLFLPDGGPPLGFSCGIFLGVVKVQLLEEIEKYSIKPAIRFAQSRREMASGHPARGRGWGP